MSRNPPAACPQPQAESCTSHPAKTRANRLQRSLSHLFSFRFTSKLIKIIQVGLVQTKPVRSKTANVVPGPVRPSGETGPDQAPPQTGSVRTAGIIGINGRCARRVTHSKCLNVCHRLAKSQTECLDSGAWPYCGKLFSPGLLDLPITSSILFFITN